MKQKVLTWLIPTVIHHFIGRGIYLQKLDDQYIIQRPRTFDPYIIWEIYGDECYRPLKKIDVSAGKDILDLGAHVGTFTVWAAKTFNPKRTIAVEMNEENFNLLCKNIAFNDLDEQVTLIHRGIHFSTDKQIFFHVPFHNAGGTSARVVEDGSSGSSTSITFNELIKQNKIERIALLKMDIEGAEKFVFTEDNKKYLSEKVDYLVMEGHNTQDYSITDSIDYLKSCDFKIKTFRPWYNRSNMIIHAYKEKNVS